MLCAVTHGEEGLKNTDYTSDAVIENQNLTRGLHQAAPNTQGDNHD